MTHTDDGREISSWNAQQLEDYFGLNYGSIIGQMQQYGTHFQNRHTYKRYLKRIKKYSSRNW